MPAYLISRSERPPIPETQKIVDLPLTPAMILGSERIDTSIDADVANKEIRTLNKVGYLINRSPAETTCTRCHLALPSLAIWRSEDNPQAAAVTYLKILRAT
jgi:hypothetical protein